MKKNMFISVVVVFCSTLFLLSFLSSGFYLLDKFASGNTIKATDVYSAFLSTDHTFVRADKNFKKTDIELGRQENRDVITIAFAGDMIMEGSIEEAMNKHGANYPFLQVQDELQKVDYAIVNLETAVTKRGTVYSKEYNFRTGPESLQGLIQAGFNMVSLANNHTNDYGEEGLLDTIDYLDEVGLDYVGAGKNSDQAYAAKFIEIKDKQIAILGFSRVLPNVSWYAGESKPGIASGYQLERMVQIISEVKADADYVFVYMHWGVERNQTPEPYQKNDARAMIDAGADGIFGSHAHVIQGLDFYNGKPIAYSLGNFLFPDYVHGLTAESSLLTVEIAGDEIRMKYTPYEIIGNQVATLTAEDQHKRIQFLEKISFDIIRKGDIFKSAN